MRSLLLLALVSFISGCASCGVKTCATTAECGAGFVCSGGRCQASGGDDAGANDGGSGDGGHETAVDAGQVSLSRIEVTPAMATLQSINGGTPTQTFAVTAFFDDGSSLPIADADFSADHIEIGTVQPIGGLFTASGLVGGLVTSTASVTYRGVTRSTPALITVQIEQTLGPATLPTDVPAHFAGTPLTDPARTAEVVYPLDGVVFPQNVAPADVQWLNGDVGDWFEVKLTKSNITVTSYVAEDGNHHLVIDAQGWRSFAQTNPSEGGRLVVKRWVTASSELIAGTAQALTFAPASLAGSIYYWDIERGRIVRIDDGTTTRTEFMPSPPPGVDNAQCVGCHAVSPSGRYMAGRLGGSDNIGAIFDLTTDLTANPAPTVWPVRNQAPETARWWFSTWNPDETRLALTQDDGNTNNLAFMDPRDGSMVAVSNIPALRVTHPSWSPDGTKLALVSFPNPGGGGTSADQGDITIVPFTAADALGAPAQIHTGTSLAGETPGGNADSYPSWSPDSQWLAFAHGTNGRSDTGTSALYLMKPDGSQLRRLTRASGGATADLTFQPRFSPFKKGGYYWMSFLSRRDYGNTQVGTRGRSRQQIWVSAIRETPDSSNDPSEVGYWLPGQDTGSKNIAAYWAPRACRQAGTGCTVGSECCSGTCGQGDGGLTCSPPPPEACRREGQTCGGTGDCCAGLSLVCAQNACVLDIQ